MRKIKKPTNIVIYQTKNGAIELKMDVTQDTFWLTQQQVAEVFDVQKAAISIQYRLQRIYRDISHRQDISVCQAARDHGTACQHPQHPVGASNRFFYRIKLSKAPAIEKRLHLYGYIVSYNKFLLRQIILLHFAKVAVDGFDIEIKTFATVPQLFQKRFNVIS